MDVQDMTSIGNDGINSYLNDSTFLSKEVIYNRYKEKPKCLFLVNLFTVNSRYNELQGTKRKSSLYREFVIPKVSISRRPDSFEVKHSNSTHS